MKKKMMIALSLLIICTLIASCDSGLAYQKMEFLTLPEKTVYKVGEDSILQFDGGMIQLTTRDGRTETRTLNDYTYQHSDCYQQVVGGFISSNVNFDVPGEYIVTVWQTKDVCCQYVVTVE